MRFVLISNISRNIRSKKSKIFNGKLRFEISEVLVFTVLLTSVFGKQQFLPKLINYKASQSFQAIDEWRPASDIVNHDTENQNQTLIKESFTDKDEAAFFNLHFLDYFVIDNRLMESKSRPRSSTTALCESFKSSASS